MECDYPVRVAEEGGAFVMTARDLPHIVWTAARREDVEARAVEAFRDAFEACAAAGAPVPAASRPRAGEVVVTLPLSLAAKVILHNTMLARGVLPAELGRRLGLPAAAVARLMSFRHAVKIDMMQQAVRAAGGRLRLTGG
ncbi:MAG: hypothetical protein HUK26_07725 [Duodenibacillus sp.]|nr:hypothetical protein [Duodenibacillus sp.]